MIAANNPQYSQVNSLEEPKINFSSACGINNQYISKDQQETRYDCPINCEGNKTYIQSGECPVCYMQLVMTGSIEPTIQVG